MTETRKSDSSQGQDEPTGQRSQPGPTGSALSKNGDHQRDFDFLVIGSGLAGMHYALRVAEVGDVAIITKREATDSATDWAQGGIAAVMDPKDTFDAHAADTMNAGGGSAMKRPSASSSKADRKRSRPCSSMASSSTRRRSPVPKFPSP